MKSTFMAVLAALLVCTAVPAHAFIDYLFSGSANRGAIGNSAVGEMRAWWSGNPVYNFNPYYGGPARPPQAGGQQQMQSQYGAGQASGAPSGFTQYGAPTDQYMQQVPSPTSMYVGPQGAAPGAYGPPQYQPQYAQPQQGYAQPYAQPAQPAYGGAQPMQGAPVPQYQPPAAGYQQPPAGYTQAPPTGYPAGQYQ